MTCFDREAYKSLKRAAKSAGDVYVVSRDTSSYSGISSGVSVAFRPAIENTNCRMLEVAVSYCSVDDKYKRKHGKYQALRKLANGEVVQLPLAATLFETHEVSVGEMLLNMFEF